MTLQRYGFFREQTREALEKTLPYFRCCPTITPYAFANALAIQQKNKGIAPLDYRRGSLEE